MKKKMIITIGIVAVVLILLAVAGSLYWNLVYVPAHTVRLDEMEGFTRIDEIVKDENGAVELIAICDSEEEAIEIGSSLGIELKRYNDGVALFATFEDPEEVMARGREQGLPELSYNFIRKAFDESSDKMKKGF